MSELCRILSALTLTVHLMVGCCAHHAHGCEGNLAPAHSDAGHDGQCGDSDHAQHGANDCHGVRCSFVFPSRPVGDWLAAPSHASVAVLFNDLPALAGFRSARFLFASGRLPPPVRLHLANQVLLI